MDILAHIIAEHAREAALLWALRTHIADAPTTRLADLLGLDERLAAHLDGLRIAGAAAWPICRAGLDDGEAGAVFAAAVRALETAAAQPLASLCAGIAPADAAADEFSAALVWAQGDALSAHIRTLLAADAPGWRRIAIAGGAGRRRDCAAALPAALASADPRLRATALDAAGVSGQQSLLALCRTHLTDADTRVRATAAGAALLLGDRQVAPTLLATLALTPGPWQAQALMLALLVADLPGAEDLVTRAADAGAPPRLLISAAGFAGSARYLPWLIDLLRDDRLARPAGAALALLTGIDLETAGLCQAQGAPGCDDGPNDDPDDARVVLDPDADLPWPDAARTQAWWRAEGHRYPPSTRLFLGTAPTPAHCWQVLRAGTQPQRTLAALHLTLALPGTVLFPVAAPALWQWRWLAQPPPGG